MGGCQKADSMCSAEKNVLKCLKRLCVGRYAKVEGAIVVIKGNKDDKKNSHFR